MKIERKKIGQSLFLNYWSKPIARSATPPAREIIVKMTYLTVAACEKAYPLGTLTTRKVP